MAETITLPRSGVVLNPCDSFAVRRWIGWITPAVPLLRVELVPVGSKWNPRVAGRGATVRTRDECIAWLDARVLELRAALMPADARERVAKVLFDKLQGGRYGRTPIPWEEQGECQNSWREAADAVLAALGVRP